MILIGPTKCLILKSAGRPVGSGILINFQFIVVVGSDGGEKKISEAVIGLTPNCKRPEEP